MNLHKRNKLLAIFSLFLTISVNVAHGQTKESAVQDFQSPFKQEKSQRANQVIRPRSNARSGAKDLVIPISNGHFQKDLSPQALTKDQLEAGLSGFLQFSEESSLSKIKETTDTQGFTHIQYQQLFRGIPIEGAITSAHFRNGKSEFLNGHAAQSLHLGTTPAMSGSEAEGIAKQHLHVTELLNSYPVELVIARVPPMQESNYKLMYKVRIDSKESGQMNHVYVDANTGEVLNKISLMAHADAAGTANTLYSGAQSITHDSFIGGFRLRESGRKIETFDATTAVLGPTAYAGHEDFVNSSSTWSGFPRLSSVTITSVVQTWWYELFSDQNPDLYIVVEDALGQSVFNSMPVNNATLPITISDISVLMVNPPYTIKIYDKDFFDFDDFGGSYSVAMTVGTSNWSGNGNNGTYLVDTKNNPALDVHWGMEKTYDFYLNTFGRNSFDGNGTIIKQYVNSPYLQERYGGNPNNALARPSPYNLMEYGLGNGQYMNPVVGLDVEGHEFTHLVVNNNGTGGLVYQGESGALNESFADILGTGVEFYTRGAGANWSIGEGVMVASANLRSMSNPNNPTGDTQQPDTYNGTYWSNPANVAVDGGGVHINSGVQNFWFYLLSEGGSGTNDIGNPFSVSGIGMDQALQIAYRNLTTYLTPNATFVDSYLGSLQAAQDLFGNPSSQYTAVRAAWYAVGIGNDPNSYCNGVTKITASTGTVSDGSGNANYNDNTSCKWVIAPPGATQLTLNFTAFDTEADFDIVTVYDGPDDTFPVLATWWGNTLPSTINSSGGALCIKFTSDGTINGAGWTANYTSSGAAPSCSGGTILSSPSGSLTDGSGGANYGNNQLCYWLIAPPCATSVSLTLTQLNTELSYDGIAVYDGPSVSSPLLGAYSGTSLPSPVTATSGQMLVVFISDYSTVSQGFAANYTSTGSATCSGTTALNAADYGIISDGSGANNYCNNLDCQWLIQPPQATKVTLNFTAFDLENPASDGSSIYDAVEVYDGTTTAAPLLARFSGSNLPPAVTSTGGSLLIRFYSDPGEVKQGWSAYYTSQTTTYCSGPTTLTTLTGSLNDGSGANAYGNNTQCSWLIKPSNAKTITLTFSAFDTELNADGIIVYDGETNAAPVLGILSGSSIPTALTSTGGSMYLEFISDEALRANGWSASYTSTLIVGLEDEVVDSKLLFFPNPADRVVTVRSDYSTTIELQILDVTGKPTLRSQRISQGDNSVDVSELSSGVYLLQFQIGNENKIKRVVIH